MESEDQCRNLIGQSCQHVLPSDLSVLTLTRCETLAEEKMATDEELLTFTHFAQYFAQRAQAKHAESASIAQTLQEEQVC